MIDDLSELHEQWEENYANAWLSFIDIARLAVIKSQGISPCTGPDTDLAHLLYHIDQLLAKYSGEESNEKA